jgi:hypothetical protein
MQEFFNLASFFTSNLASVLKCTANAFSVHLAGMMNLILLFVSVLSSTTFIYGPLSRQIEPLIAYFLNYGASGVNKFFIDTASIFEKGLCPHRYDIPVRDNTATTAAAIQKQSQHRNLHRSTMSGLLWHAQCPTAPVEAA